MVEQKFIIYYPLSSTDDSYFNGYFGLLVRVQSRRLKNILKRGLTNQKLFTIF